MNFRELFGTVVDLFEQLPQVSRDLVSWFITYNPNTEMRPIEFFLGAGLAVYVTATVIKYVVDIIL